MYIIRIVCFFFFNFIHHYGRCDRIVEEKEIKNEEYMNFGLYYFKYHVKFWLAYI